MTCSSMILRSSVVGSFALLALLGCERDNAQPGGAQDETTGAAVGSAGTGAGMRTGNEAERTSVGRATGTSADRPAADEIERTSGRDETLGSGGTASKMGGSGGRGGTGGTTARP
jgi:hypothetical protein